MATGWFSEAWPLVGSQDGFLRHGHLVGFRGMAAGWVVGWVYEAWPLDGWNSEARPLGGFQRLGCWVGHWMGF